MKLSENGSRILATLNTVASSLGGREMVRFALRRLLDPDPANLALLFFRGFDGGAVKGAHFDIDSKLMTDITWVPTAQVISVTMESTGHPFREDVEYLAPAAEKYMSRLSSALQIKDLLRSLSKELSTDEILAALTELAEKRDALLAMP